MKIRNGFVSNSSSSSFIIFGVELGDSLNYEELSKKYIKESSIKEYIGDNTDDYIGDGKDDYWRDLWYENAYDGNFSDEEIDLISDDSMSYIGKKLADGDDELEQGEITISELTEFADKLGFEGSKLYFGTRAC